MPKFVKNRVRELIAAKETRENRRISRQTVADETGLSKASVQRWATNTTQRFDAPHIIAFCKFFNCTVADLIVIEEADDTGQHESLLAAVI